MPVLTVIGLLIFFSVFVGIVIWTYRVIEKNKWQEIATLAIQDEPIKTAKGARLEK